MNIRELLFSPLVLTLIVFFTTNCTAQNTHYNKAKLDSLFSILQETDKSFGSVSIYKNGKEIYQNTCGYSNLNDKIRSNQNTLFRIGSVTKTFTAAVILKLIEEGKLSMGTKISKFYPHLEKSNNISIAHMLKHRSGIFNYTNVGNITSWSRKPIAKKDLIQRINGLGLESKPNEKGSYSNSNYVLLGFIAEEIEGKTLDEIFKERIFKPFGLTNTYYGNISDNTRMARSYIKNRGWGISKLTNLTVLVGSGAITSTPTDVNKFYSALFQGKFISTASLATMMKIKDGFGAGIVKTPFIKKTGYGHTGKIDGFASTALYLPEDKLSVVYLSNAVNMPLKDILMGILRINYGYKYDLNKLREKKLAAVTLDNYVGVYSSPELPLTFTVTAQGGILSARATGQAAFVLKALGKNKFEYESAGINLEFLPAQSKLNLKQGNIDVDFMMQTYSEFNLNQYAGIFYLRPALGETATVTVQENRLLIKTTWTNTVTDQSAWAYEKNKFASKEVDFRFFEEDGRLILEWVEAGETYTYLKKK